MYMAARRVLVVDDEANIRNIICLFLRKAGFEAVEAADGRDALSIVRRLKGNLDLILTDMVMPRMDGSALITAATRQYPHLKTVLMSGYNPGPKDLGVPFLHKPFEIDTMVRMVRKQFEPEGSNRAARRAP